jgi:hypothetical protein
MGRYGAFTDIDFSPVFDKFIEEGCAVQREKPSGD